MGKGYKHGTSGGANPLNFTVKTYPSETELKADKPKENTIGVITTTTMTSWVFSATEPAELEVGIVLISVGNASPVEFNALNKNTLNVYPISAKQYVGGKLESKTAYSYQGGEWVDWLEEGQIFPPTSGWKIQKMLADSKYTLSSNARFEDNVFKATLAPNTDGTIALQNFDYTDIKTIEVYFNAPSLDGYNGNFTFFASDYQYHSNGKEILYKHASAQDHNNGVMNVDVSGVTGKHWLIVGGNMWLTTGDIEITKIKAVK